MTVSGVDAGAELVDRWDQLDEDQRRQAVDWLAVWRSDAFRAALDFEIRTRPPEEEA